MDVLVIVDDLATLDWLGFSVLDITRFCRALAAACRKVCAILSRVHSIAQVCFNQGKCNTAHPTTRPYAIQCGADAGRPVPGPAPDVYIPHGRAAACERA